MIYTPDDEKNHDNFFITIFRFKHNEYNLNTVWLRYYILCISSISSVCVDCIKNGRLIVVEKNCKM